MSIYTWFRCNLLPSSNCLSGLFCLWLTSDCSVCGTEHWSLEQLMLPDNIIVFFLPDPEAVDQDSKMHKEPLAQSVISTSSPTKHFSSTIYTEAVKFLLQNNALQVKTHMAKLSRQLHSHWSK